MAGYPRGQESALGQEERKGCLGQKPRSAPTHLEQSSQSLGSQKRRTVGSEQGWAQALGKYQGLPSP